MNLRKLSVLLAVIASASLNAKKDKDSVLDWINQRVAYIAKTVTKLSEEAECQTLIMQSDIGTMGYVISAPGNYCLGEDVVFNPASAGISAITIAAPNVELFMNNYYIQQVGQLPGVNGISINPGLYNVAVKNGELIGFSQDGILAGDPTLANTATIRDLIIGDITSTNNAFNGVRVFSTTGAHIYDLTATGTVAGERFLQLNSSNDILVEKSSGIGFTSTIGSILEVNSCVNVVIQDVIINDNIKAVTAVNGTAQQTAFAMINISTEVSLMRVKINNNTNTTSATNGYSVLYFFGSPNCAVVDSQVCFNSDIAGGINAQDSIIRVNQSDNFIGIDTQANYNTVPTTVQRLIVVNGLNNKAPYLDGVQANFNSVSALSVVAGSSYLQMIYFTSAIIGTGFSAEFRNCQTNFNSVGSGGGGRGATNFGVLEGLHVDHRASIVDNHQANDNTMGDTNFNTQVVGIEMGGLTGTSVLSNSQANFNTGGAESFGISFDVTAPFFLDADKLITNCTASSNGTYGIDMNFGNTTTNSGSGIVIRDCMVGNNGGPTGPAIGIFLRQLTGGLRNCLISGCQIFDTRSTATLNGNATGISANGITNLVIEDTLVFDTVGTNSSFTGYGILLNGCKNGTIKNTQVNTAQTAGFELIGTNTGIAFIECIAEANAIGFEFATGSTPSCCLVQDCTAINNTVFGFVYAPATLTTTFIGNEAQCNGTSPLATNYVINGGVIPVQQLSWATGNSTLISGNQALGAPIANVIAST